MKDIKVELTKVKNYEFTGKIQGSDLNEFTLYALGFNSTQVALGLEVEIFGEFEIEWDYEIPMAQILYATLVGTDGTMIDINLKHLDLDDLSELLTQFDDGSWAQDKYAALVDKAAARLGDK